MDEAFPGDIVGIPDTGNFKIGDTLVEGSRELHFKGLPSFSPEMFKYIENTDPMKSKQLEKGIHQLMDEGVAQLFTNQFNGRKIIGTVGQLQFEVIQYRLLHEYGAQCRWEPISLYKACWIESDNEAALDAFKKRKYQYIATDTQGRDVFLADSNYVLQMAQHDFPDIKFHFQVNFNPEKQHRRTAEEGPKQCIDYIYTYIKHSLYDQAAYTRSRRHGLHRITYRGRTY